MMNNNSVMKSLNFILYYTYVYNCIDKYALVV